jgi:DNA-3-methyladenine glycosylase
MPIFKREFFNRPTLKVSKDLLGKFLVRKYEDGKIESFMITEVEAYDGEKDLASHASKGKTKRTDVMYGEPGYFYVYLCYGMHYMLNIVTGPKDYPAAILIRSLEKVKGPGVVTKKLKIGKEFNKKKAGKESGLWFEDRGIIIKASEIIKTPRIGVFYAKEWAHKPYRFLIKD